MKQKFLCLAVLCLPFLGFCQEALRQNQGDPSTSLRTGSGIQWVEGLSWQQVKEKAKKENKYIFVDCFTTWCGPCKKMDKEVYTVDSVGSFLNAGFISVKLQMDVNKNDNADVKSWYKTAREIGKQYRILAYPSYVFFAPSGEVVSKGIGYKDPGVFIQVARNATDSSKQYFSLLKKYKQGQLDHAGTVSLINMALQIGDTADSRQILNSYYAYLHKQKKEKLYTKENIEFIASTLDRSSMVLFDMFYPNGKEVNKVMQNNWYAKRVVDRLIWNEKVEPFLKTAEGKPEPDWNILYNDIAKNYKGDYADRNVLYAKQPWYSSHEDFLNEARCFNEGMEKYGTDTTSLGEDFKLNSKANFLFIMNIKDRKELGRAISWMEGVARRGEKATGEYLGYWPLYIDTYASLLYKIGRTSEAIKWQEVAAKKCLELRGEDDGYSKAVQRNLIKMKKGEPTW